MHAMNEGDTGKRLAHPPATGGCNHADADHADRALLVLHDPREVRTVTWHQTEGWAEEEERLKRALGLEAQ